MLNKSCKVLVLCAASICAMSACALKEGVEIGGMMRQGNKLVEKGKYPEAEQEYTEVIKLIDREQESKSLTVNVASVLKAHVFAKMGILYTKEKNYPQAESKFTDGLKLFEGSPKLSKIARRNMKECLQAYGDLLDAENHPDRAKVMHDRASATVTD
jgi:tetratricopeptide (TPR) repeat protein